MKLVKIRKRKTWSSTCNGLYDYKKQETFYIVELNEKEYIKLLTLTKGN